MKKILFSAAALAVLFTACKDDDTNPEPQVTNKFFLNAVSEQDSISATYTAAGKIDRFDEFSKDGGADYAYFWYSQAVYENGKLTKVMASEKSAATLKQDKSFVYDASGKIQKINFYSSETGLINSYDSLVYDANNRLATLYFIEGVDGDNSPMILQQKAVLVWNAAKNVEKAYIIRIDEEGVESKDTFKLSYTFDDKVNFKSRQPEFLFINPDDAIAALSANNIKTSIEKDRNYEVQVTNEYTYDETNYPVTIKSVEKDLQDGTVIYTNTRNIKVRYITR